MMMLVDDDGNSDDGDYLGNVNGNDNNKNKVLCCNTSLIEIAQYTLTQNTDSL